MAVAGAFSASLPALAVPHEGRGLLVPGLRRLLEPGADLGWALRMLPGEGAAFQDALDRLRQVQPAAAQRRVEWHDAVPAEPQHHLRGLVAGEIVPDQQQAQWPQLVRQGEAHRQILLPRLPETAVLVA